ncbi:TatD family hydrolase [Granulosicoccaceae sp. 1_MG-2023]|nr:TatD family hydrolase [Granulosicoccaceae sp. 1_MG-2023]
MSGPTPRLIDSHCHIDDARFSADLSEVLERARRQGISMQVVPAVRRDGWQHLKDLCRQHPQLHPCYGLHPYFLAHHREADIAALDHWLSDTPCVALGECGLDYLRKDTDRLAQRKLFAAQLELAAKHQLPVVLHVNKAVEDILLMLADSDVRGGLMHAFNGSEQQAERAIARGFKLGFGGAATYTRARRLRHLLSELPLSALMIETDAPDQPPASHHGERNEPAFLRDIFAHFCTLRRESPVQLAAAFNHNARSLFALPDDPFEQHD